MRAITNHGWRAQPAAQPPPRQHQQHQPHQPPSTIAPSLAFAPSTAFPRHDEGPGISMSFSSRPPLVPQTDDFSPASLSRPRYGNDEGEGDGDRDGDGDDALLPVMEGLQNLSLRQKRELLRHLQRQTEAEADVPGSAGPTATATATPGMLGPPPPSSRELAAARDWASSHGRTPEGVTRLQSEARRFGSFVRRHAASGFSPAQLSRIYSLEVALFGAVFANCYALGMRDVEGLMVEEGVSVFSLDQDTGHPPSQLAALRSRFREITPDLQPCDVQLTFGHHPYIDVLPFRSFRDNALKALQHDPPLFDEDEFCFDFCGGGLICWGSQQSSMGMEAGVPWDARSWEPQVWFLKKYWYLVGGWNDDMWRAARWWHSLRGEKINMHAPEPPATWAPCRKEP